MPLAILALKVFNTSSSCCVSATISESSVFLLSRSASRNSTFSLLSVTTSPFCSACAWHSRMRFSHNSISRVWYSISLFKDSNSRLLRTLFCCSVYFAIKALLSSI